MGGIGGLTLLKALLFILDGPNKIGVTFPGVDLSYYLSISDDTLVLELARSELILLLSLLLFLFFPEEISLSFYLYWSLYNLLIAFSSSIISATVFGLNAIRLLLFANTGFCCTCTPTAGLFDSSYFYEIAWVGTGG